MRKTKKALGIALFFIVGLSLVYLYSLRIQQVDKNTNYNNHSYYEYEMSNK